MKRRVQTKSKRWQKENRRGTKMRQELKERLLRKYDRGEKKRRTNNMEIEQEQQSGEDKYGFYTKPYLAWF